MLNRVSVLFITLTLTLTVCLAADVYVAHGVPGADVDVYVNGDLLLQDFMYTEIEGPVPVPAGDYLIEVFLAGADPQVDAPVIFLETPLLDDQNVTIVAHLAEDGGLKLTPFGNPQAPSFNLISGIVVRHTAAAPPVDINLISRSRFLRGAFRFSASNGAGAGTTVYPIYYDVSITLPGGGAEVFAIEGVRIRGGSSYAAYAVGNPADDSFTILLQEFN